MNTLNDHGEQRTENEVLQQIVEQLSLHQDASLETYNSFNQKDDEAESRKAAIVDALFNSEPYEESQYIYDRIDPEDIVKRRDELTKILVDLLDETDLDPLVHALRENLTNRIHELGILLLTKMQSDLSTDDPRYDPISFQLGQNMREVYGVPDQTHFRGILGYRLEALKKVEDDAEAPSAVVEAWRFIKEAMPKDLPIEAPRTPNDETLEWYRTELVNRVGASIDAVRDAVDTGEIVVGESNKLECDAIIQATELALKIRNINGWVVKSTKATSIDTNQDEKVIYIPETREMSVKEFNAVVICHEIDMHVMCRENGDRSTSPVLRGTGLNGYLAKEEGHGKANEGLIKGKFNLKLSAYGYFLAGGLALGLDSDKVAGRNNYQTAELVWRMNFVEQYLSGKHDGSDSAKRSIIEKAVNSLQRIFRGTDGKVPGVVFTKDVMTYYLGQVDVVGRWDESMKLPEEERRTNHLLERAGKSDISRPEHKVLVEKYKPEEIF